MRCLDIALSYIVRVYIPLPLVSSLCVSLIPCQLEAGPLTMMVAQGPFTLSDNFDYEPLSALFKVVREQLPDVLVLVREDSFSLQRR
jgi:hypothetical protein